MTSLNRRSKVGSACQRCRRQKLKCDVQRPCTLCLRAGLECQTTDEWRVVQPDTVTRKEQRVKRRRQNRNDRSQGSTPSDNNVRDTEQPWSSSTMLLVEGAFRFHNSSTLDKSTTTALPGGRGLPPAEVSALDNAHPPGSSSRQPAKNPWQQHSRSLMAELTSLLPSREVASLLVDTYFDRIHWFMLIFHQDDFRRSWQQLYDLPRESLVDTGSSPGFTSLFLMVIAIALQYAGAYRRRLLESYGIDPTALKEKLFSNIRAKLLDIVSLGSLEAVQTCVLLGTYYLYHGNPQLAWPVCGCGLRLAQALNLHRKWPRTGPTSSEMLRQYETRKRCWWAIYEIETFCSMSYGYPHGVKDADCDVELLNPLAQSAADQTHQCPASLLSYKYLMSKLSVIVKDTLTDLYGLGSLQRNLHGARVGSSTILNPLIRKVCVLDTRLQQWKTEIPDALQLNHSRIAAATYNSAEDMDRDIGASGPVFETHLYQLQALALELAYENARILAHRPLLTYRTISHSQADQQSDSHSSSDPLQVSLQACRDAALKTSEIDSAPIFSLAADTYAAAFIGIHTFTAGVTLCILASIEPLGPQSYQSKLGLRRLLSMQGHLKSRSHALIAAQGVEILERLARLAMEKELKVMLTSSEATRPEPCASTGNERDMREAGSSPSDARGWDMAGTTLNERVTFDYVEDPAVSQALCDLDQVLSSQDLNPPLDPFLSDSLCLGNGFAQEQAWIWGVDSLVQLPEDSG